MTTPPRRLAPGDRRRQILAAALRLLDRKPLEDITVEEVAGLAGVSPGLLFHYFGTLRKFRRALAETAAQELLARLAPDPAHSPAEQLRTALEAVTEYVARRPGLYLAVTRVSGSNQDLRDLHDGIRGTLSAWLITALRTAGVPDTPVLAATVAGWLAYTEEVLLVWLTQAQMTREEVVVLCERACYRLVQAAIGDPATWRRVEQAIASAPDYAVRE